MVAVIRDSDRPQTVVCMQRDFACPEKMIPKAAFMKSSIPVPLRSLVSSVGLVERYGSPCEPDRFFWCSVCRQLSLEGTNLAHRAG
ncbi:hypothetical protein M406DRAFT_355075 [Cryphonectria parasitica EP155]|uniref:Uncharacterized protein n=1 Tax=Cryphonectria parasitica (strain ATCC 38755 / EP155) TaxID=660469 RepID=A0A9P4Y9J6_CRYP1|nr:uncharacterized protein M406DRAFT_355075 [Cryphonectria parasitica EP155]KAF3768914.1 hypothetical protein M406DRAFT_355075 [Cryphonectria parasitica EP155]